MANTPHTPDKKSRLSVKLMVAGGMDQAKIAMAVGISEPTLRKHYRAELDSGAAEIEGAVRGRLGFKALQGDNACMIFLLKTRFGDRELRVAVGGDENAPPIKIDAKVQHDATEALGNLMAQLAIAKASMPEEGS